jgi:O-antigen ligase
VSALADVAIPPPAVRAGRPAALVLLQTFAWLSFLLPARLVIGPLGAFGMPANLVGLAAFVLWASGAARPGLLVRTVVPVRVAVLCLWVPVLASYAVMHLNATAADEVNAADRRILFLLVWSGVTLLAAEGLRDVSDVLRLLRVVVAGAAVTAGVALLQSRLGLDVTTWMTRIPGLTVNGELQSVLDRAGWRRAAGTATHPLELGTTMAMVLGPALALASHDRTWALWRRLTAVVLIAFAIPISLSRSAAISVAIVAVFWFAGTDWKGRVRGLAAVFGFVVVLFMTTPGLIGLFRSLFGALGTDTSISTRVSDYGAIAPYVRQSPWIGRGPATFLPRFRVLDNQWMLSLVETGILGIVGLLVYVALLGGLGASLRRRGGELVGSVGLALLGASAVVAWALFTFDFFSFQMSAAVLALFLGVAGALYGVIPASSTSSDHDLSQSSRERSVSG